MNKKPAKRLLMNLFDINYLFLDIREFRYEKSTQTIAVSPHLIS